MQVVVPLRLLHVLYVEDLVVKIGFLQDQADRYFMCEQGRLANLGLVQGALAVGFVVVELDHALLQCIIHIDADLSDHYHEKFFSKVALLE